MFKRIIDYSNKHFNLFDLVENITDARQKPQISASDIAASILSMLFCGLGSLNKFNVSRDISYVLDIAAKVPSSSTVARSSDTIDLDAIREILKSIYLNAKRSKMIEPYCGKCIGIIDGHEIFSSDIHWCKACSIEIQSKVVDLI